MKINDVAMVCHEVNRAYCKALNDFSQESWESAPKWQKDSAKAGVLFHMNNPHAATSANHESWMHDKIKNGWKYGPVEDPQFKEHPCLIHFSRLPKEEQAKDYIFKSVVEALRNFLDHPADEVVGACIANGETV